MCSPVCREDLVVEVFYAQAEPRDADLFQRLQLSLLNRTGLTLERYFRVDLDHQQGSATASH